KLRRHGATVLSMPSPVKHPGGTSDMSPAFQFQRREPHAPLPQSRGDTGFANPSAPRRFGLARKKEQFGVKVGNDLAGDGSDSAACGPPLPTVVTLIVGGNDAGWIILA